MEEITGLPPKAVQAAEVALGDGKGMEAAIVAALDATRFKPEYAVPCLGPAACRTIFLRREEAERKAATEGGVIETRVSSPWVPERD